MSEVKLLTVVIPTKNRADLLGKSIEAFSNFTHSLDLIVVDDCSVEEHKIRNKLIVERVGSYFFLNDSMGGCHARNFGAKSTKTPFIWFFDDDDIVSPKTVEDVLKALEEYKNNDVFLLPMEIINNNKSERIVIPEVEKNNFEAYRSHAHQVNTSCTIIKRESLIRAGMWDENLVAAQDTDLFLRLSIFSKYICLETEPVKVIVTHTDRITKNMQKQHKARLQFLIKNWKLLSFKNRLRYILSYIRTSSILIKVQNIFLK